MSRVLSPKLGILRKTRIIYEEDNVLRRCFFSFILPHFEFCSAVRSSAADSHIKLLDRMFNSIKFLLSDLDLDIEHRRAVGSLSILYKLVNDASHPLHKFLPGLYQPIRVTRNSESLNSLAFNIDRVSTSQFSRCFFPATCKLWNKLPTEIVTSPTVDRFKRLVNSYLLNNR